MCFLLKTLIIKVQGPKGSFGKGKPLVKVFGIGSETGWVGFFSSEMHPLAPPPRRAPAFGDLQLRFPALPL